MSRADGAMNLLSAVSATLKGHVTEPILGPPKAAQASVSASSSHQGRGGSGMTKTKMARSTNYNHEKGCASGSAFQMAIECRSARSTFMALCVEAGAILNEHFLNKTHLLLCFNKRKP